MRAYALTPAREACRASAAGRTEFTSGREKWGVPAPRSWGPASSGASKPCGVGYKFEVVSGA